MCLGAIYWARLAAVYYACTRKDAAGHRLRRRLYLSRIKAANSGKSIPMTALE
jgi:guanine deaminase